VLNKYTGCLLKVSMAAFFISAPGVAGAKVIDRVVAVVGDQPLLLSDLEQAKLEIKKTPALAAAYRLESEQIDDAILLERMIEDKVIQQLVKEQGLEASDADVEKQISNIARQNGIS